MKSIIELIIARDRAQSSLDDMKALVDEPDYAPHALAAVSIMEELLELVEQDITRLDVEQRHLATHIVISNEVDEPT